MDVDDQIIQIIRSIVKKLRDYRTMGFIPTDEPLDLPDEPVWDRVTCVKCRTLMGDSETLCPNCGWPRPQKNKFANISDDKLTRDQLVERIMFAVDGFRFGEWSLADAVKRISDLMETNQ